MYDKVAEYLTLLARTELLTCSATQVSYTKIKEQSQTVSNRSTLPTITIRFRPLNESKYIIIEGKYYLPMNY